MRGRKNVVGEIYPKYVPYPTTWDLKEGTYSSENPADSRSSTPNGKNASMQDFHELISDPDFPGRSSPESLPSNDESHLRPLRLLQSLFADRLDFLQRALDELEGAKRDREQLAQYALKELDPEIRECEVSLSALKAAMNNTERRRDLERRLFELKRQRRREALTSWRDLVWLRGEIRKLQREIDALDGTNRSASNVEVQGDSRVP
ncbi:MAG: hypothetical protein JXC85_04415 [Candidatus Aenigmarchaeota archaeon]|nr:hypothetical protein [Candidatus Aenigmarchaeota archaeon]